MSKLTKLFKNPRLFFEDAKINRDAKLVAGVNKASLPTPANKAPPANPKATENKKLDIKQSAAKPVLEKIKDADKTRDGDLVMAKKLLNFEAIYPVNNIESLLEPNDTEKLKLWPFLRHMLWVRSRAAYKGAALEKMVTTKMYISQEWRKHYRAIAGIRDVPELAESECDFLFFTNLRGTEQTRIDNKIYNRITDPVFEIAQKIGRSKKVEIVKSIGTIAENRFRFNPADLVYPPLLRKVGYFELCDIPENFVPRVKEFLPELKFANDQLRNELEFFFHQRDFYVDLLKKYNPKVVFFIGFDYHYALILAARSLGIKSVDLQHGVQAGWSPVYNNWQALPVAGYEMLPDYFWVWGRYDEVKIKENFPVNGVTPIIGGFPWLERQKSFFSDEGSKGLWDFKKGSSEGQWIGIITLQDQSEFPGLFRDIILATSGKVRWIIKRHPKHLNIKLDSVRRKAHYGKHFDDLSFAALLKIVDLHLTECSTSVIDADYFGIPSMVTGVQGILNYKDFIDKKQVFHTMTAQGFVEKMPQLLESKGASRMEVIDNDGTTERALRTLLNLHHLDTAPENFLPPYRRTFSHKQKKR